MKKLIVFLIIYISSFSIYIFPQGNVNYDCITQENILKSTDPDSWNYIMDHESQWDDYKRYFPKRHWPNLKIRVNLIFVQKDDGTGNFQEDNQEHMSLIDEMLIECQNTFSHLNNLDFADPNCYSGNYSFISDTKVEFVFNKVFYKSTYYWNIENGGICPSANWYINPLDRIIVSDQTIPKGINVYFVEEETSYNNSVIYQTDDGAGVSVSCSQLPTTKNLEASSRVCMPSCFTRYWVFKNIKCAAYDWETCWMRTLYIRSKGRGFAHELGHSLGLGHSNQWHGDNECDNSIMHQNWDNPRDYLPPTEIGKIHLALSITNLSQFVTYDSYIPDPIVIQHNEQWNYDIRTYRNISVNNSILDINCVLKLPPYGQNLFDNYSILNINEELDLEGTGEVIMNSNTTFRVDSEANIKVSDNSKLEMKNGSYICIEQGASLNLVDGLSVINLRPGYNIGVNTNVIPDPGNCLSDPANVPITGNGSINTFTDDIYIQNETISSDRYISGENIYVGRAVTTAKPIGNVVINNNARVIFEGTQNVNLEGGFEVNTGSAIEVK